MASATSNLNLRSGSASYSLMKQGGPLLQSECEKLYPTGIQDGEVAVIGSGNLNCDQVYLSSLPSWKDALGNHCKASLGSSLINSFRNTLKIGESMFVTTNTTNAVY